ncbi:MAG: hypothetical protein E7641_07205 [Ruminococcaceae bacterium]|nr:hypothetical protein [Oscillospiraceae bacterium]
MKKNEKLKINYRPETHTEAFFNSLSAADENDLRLLLSLSMLAEPESADYEALRSSLELSEAEFDASVKYWCGAGVLKKGRGSFRTSAKTKEAAPAHKGGKLERAAQIPSYTSAELAALLEARADMAGFIDEAQRVMGKMFNVSEINILIGMVDYIGFDKESVIVILSYVAKLEKRSLRYAEKVALSLSDEGISDIDALQERLSAMENYTKREAEVVKMFGMGGRSLTTKEKRFLESWITKMNYDIDCIRLAYDITVDNIQSPAPAYANSILEKWYSEGLRSYGEIVEAENKKRAARGLEAKDQRSFDTDEFFEAALKRTFDEL